MVSEAQDSPSPINGERAGSPVSDSQPPLELPDAGLPELPSPGGERLTATLSWRADITRSLIVIASVTVIIYGMHSAALYLVQIFLAAFIAIITQPVVFHLRRQGWPMGLILIAAGLLLAGTVILGGVLAMDGLRAALAKAPIYQEAISKEIKAASVWLDENGVPMNANDLNLLLEPTAFVDTLRPIVAATADMSRYTFTVVLLVIFIWLEAPRLPKRLEPHLRPQTTDRLRRNLFDLRHYMALKAVLSLMTGVCVSLWCFVMDVPFAFVMGLAAFILNFVPVIGSIIAAVPALAISFIDHGTAHMLAVTVGYLVINIGISNGLEPRVLGRGLGLSPLAIVLSLLIWGWILGPVGMLLSVPLTMTIRAMLKDVDGCETCVAMLSNDEG